MRHRSGAAQLESTKEAESSGRIGSGSSGGMRDLAGLLARLWSRQGQGAAWDWVRGGWARQIGGRGASDEESARDGRLIDGRADGAVVWVRRRRRLRVARAGHGSAGDAVREDGLTAMDL